MLYIIYSILFFFSCVGTKEISATQQRKVSLPEDSKKVPLGGNSYLTTRGEEGHVSDEGFIDWRSPASVFSTYFRVNKGGDLKLYLSYQADAENTVIDVHCKAHNFTLTLPKSEVGRDTFVYIGTIKDCEAGYVQVDFKGKELKGSVYAQASALYVSGEVAKDMSYVDDFSYYWGRRGPSVHMSYTIPSELTAEWFYNEVTVPEGQDPTGSYFMANGFSEGYFGIQVNSPTERRVLFSVWSPYKTDNPNEIPEEHKIILVKKGEGVRTGEFGNEGSGGQSYLRYNWKAGNTYRFLTHIRPDEKFGINSYFCILNKIVSLRKFREKLLVINIYLYGLY